MFGPKENEYRVVDEETVEVIIYDRFGKEVDKFLISPQDQEFVQEHQWTAQEEVFALFEGIKLKDFLAGERLKKGFHIIHLNENTRDFRSGNLRMTLAPEEKMRVAREKKIVREYPGLVRHGLLWSVCIGFKCKNVFLGLYKDLADAVYIRYVAEMLIRGKSVTAKAPRAEELMSSLSEERKKELERFVNLKLFNRQLPT